MQARKDFLTPFRVAMSGIVHTFRTQRHMRIHLMVTLVTVGLALAANLRIREIIVLLFMVTLVLVAEMFNSAIEATVDLVSPNYHPLAKFAKDIAAGAVLITTLLAVVVASLIWIGEDAWERIRVSLTSDSVGLNAPVKLILGGLCIFVIVVIGKGLGKRGQVLRGGLVSGHSAGAFFLAFSVVFISDRPLVSLIAVVLALIVAQSRWEAKIHSVFELVLGGLVGILTALVSFVLLPK